VWHFLYGPLMDPATLAGVVGLPESDPPTMRPAKVSGFQVKFVGSSGYPALDGAVGHEVHGMAWEILSREHEDRAL
jgi:hypothetical protein